MLRIFTLKPSDFIIKMKRRVAAPAGPFQPHDAPEGSSAPIPGAIDREGGRDGDDREPP